MLVGFQFYTLYKYVWFKTIQQEKVEDIFGLSNTKLVYYIFV